ncbi:Hypothetical predicted protein [Mytilus galloprovincialis]|uniref:Reverse transcriptase domain-containing protein n=1 Tax=Mytilus galloprovincialis TaxID=29158 RepID=A0A8B6FLF3_MYTGA|nr:Hypothetical predicted protein [Mytilus galloprovincialis]
MTDLCDMLKGANLGINIASELINCLLFADDIVLLGNTEEELQILLNIAHKFVSKWSLKFNSSKSKILVTGNKKDSDKKWYLGNDLIEEVNEYKYLGVYFSRSLKSTCHIEQYLKENFQRKINHAIRILGEHGDFNRINFGHSLWMSAIRPSLTYGCSVWFPSSQKCKELLESFRYKVGKIILNTKMNIPKCALLAEFGWESINKFMDRQRIAYYARLKNLPNNRLSKIILDEIIPAKCNEWKYIENIETILQTAGLDHYANGNINVNIFNKFYGNETTNTQLCNILGKSSLNLYQSFVVVSRKQSYLSNVDDFRSTRLKFLARTNCLPINATLQRMNLTTNNECQLCSSNAIENIFHVMLDCPFFSAIRKRTSTNIQACFENLKMDIRFSELPPLLQFMIDTEHREKDLHWHVDFDPDFVVIDISVTEVTAIPITTTITRHLCKSTGAIVGVVFGALIGGAVFLTGCIMCCAFCCCSGNKTSRGQVVRTNQAGIATISTSQMSSNATFNEPGVQFTPSQYSSPQQYNTEYSAPPPAYNEAVSTGNVNIGFNKDT